jgi:putative ATP-dependent endonuclease of the OLD family
MPINYWLSRLKIDHYRGIPSLNVELQPEVPTYLIGPNNAGKSTVLNAIALALRSGPFIQYEASVFDFFHPASDRPSSNFTVSLEFSANEESQYPAVQGVGSPVPVHGVRISGELEEEGRCSSSSTLLDANGKTVTFSPRTALKAEIKAEYQVPPAKRPPQRYQATPTRGLVSPSR